MKPDAGAPRTLMLGKGWFPDTVGGLDRYYRDLLERLPEASGVVIGPATTTPTRVVAVSDHQRPLSRRIAAFWRATQHAAARTDVVDTHFALYALAPMYLGRLRRTPAVLHFHGPWADESTIAGDESSARRAIRRRLERTAYKRAAQSIVLSSAFRQVLVERYRVKPWTISVVPPGVDLDRFTPDDRDQARAKLDLGPDGFVAVTIRRLTSRMGLEILLDAWAGALADLPAGSVLLLAGDGPLRERLARTVHDRRLGSSVRLLGRVPDEQLVDLYRAADVAVVPTLAHEGFGLVVLEAAACGTPSIVTDVGGLPEAIAALDPSLIVPPGDTDALRDQLLRARTRRPTTSATRTHAERYSWATAIEHHREIARRVTGRTGERERVRVVYLGHVAKLSGAELALLRLLPHLDRVHPHVILAEDGPLVGRLHLAGISTEVLPLADVARKLRRRDVRGGGVGPASATATALYILRLAHRLRQLQPDLVHTNSLKAGVYGSVAARLAGLPVIWHVRDRIADDYLPRPAVKLVRTMTRHLATAVVANSHSTMQTLAAPSTPVVIYSVLPEVMSEVPSRPRSTGTPLTFGIVGRLAPWKGQDLFLRAFARAFPTGHERAVIVGGALFGEDDYAQSLPQLGRDLGLDGRVEFRGHRDDIWDELSRLDVLVHASITAEPFGQVILEGMAAGVPVVAAGAGGPAEMITHDTTGLLFEPRNADALAEAMLRLRSEELRQRLSAGGRDSLGPYSPDVVAAELQHLYERVLARLASR